MFSDASSFNQPLNDWNVSSVTNMNAMFAGATKFNQPLNGWDVSSVSRTDNMFRDATRFNQPLNNWNVSSVTFMDSMFRDATRFNQPLNNWNVSSVTDMGEMFLGAFAFDQNLGTWYIVPTATDFDAGGTSLNVTTVSAQNQPLRDHNPVYGMGSDGHSNLFEMNGSTLAFKKSPSVGSYLATVTASGSAVFENGSNWNVLNITVHSSTDRPPIVQAGGDQTVGEGDTVTLSSSVADPDGNQVTSMWSQTTPASPPIAFANASAPSTTFTAPAVTGDTVFTIKLTANDGALSAEDTLNITVRETGTAFITTWTASDSDRDITLPMTGTYSVLWGDDSYDANVSGPQSHTYAATGTYTVTVLGNGLESINLSNDSANALQLESIEQWGGTEWTTMSGAFAAARSMVYRAADVPNLSGVSDMSDMFRSAKKFDGDLSGWDVSSVTDMSNMFSGAAAFNQPLNGWDVPSVTDMSNMFSGATSFDQPLNGWDVPSVTDMSNMFSGATSFDQPLNGWNVSSVTDMSYMFDDATSFDRPLNGWNVSSVTDMSYMFDDATSFDRPLNGWDVSSVTNMHSMFYDADSFDQPLNGWDVSSVIYMSQMFRNISDFNGDLSRWNVSSVTDMHSMFFGADSFARDLSGWDVSSVTNMHSMFSSTDFNGDLSGWDVSSVTNMQGMFFGADSFARDLSGWDVSSVTNMHTMFFGASSFNGDLSGWDVSSVTDMFRMFDGASAFNQNLGNWYVVPDTMPIARADVPGVVGTISAQNTPLNDHDPVYNVTGDGSAQFAIVNYNQLNMTSVDTKSDYAVNVTASGGMVFEDGNNWRMLDVTVTTTADTMRPSIMLTGEMTSR